MKTPRAQLGTFASILLAVYNHLHVEIVYVVFDAGVGSLIGLCRVLASRGRESKHRA